MIVSLDSPRAPARAIMLASAASLGAALFFQFVVGLQPCVLCLWQRWPYVVAFAIAAAADTLADRPKVRGTFLALAGLTFLVGAGIALFHVGVEQHWWIGTPGCGVPAGPKATTLEELKRQVLAAPVVRCDVVPWSLFGISMAGYNVLLSLGLGAFALFTARRALTSRNPA